MWNDAGWGWGWGMGFGMFGMALFWAFVIYGILVLVRRSGGSSAPSGPPTSKSAHDMLNERYARGEIDKREFDEKRRDLDK